MSLVTIFSRDVIIDGVLYPSGALWPMGIVDSLKESKFRAVRMLVEVDSSAVDTAPAPKLPPPSTPPQVIAEARERLRKAEADLREVQAEVLQLEDPTSLQESRAALVVAQERDAALRVALKQASDNASNAAVRISVSAPKEETLVITTEEKAAKSAVSKKNADPAGIPA